MKDNPSLTGLVEGAPFNNKEAQGPAGRRAFWLTTDDDIRLRAGLWQSNTSTKGTILLFPGRTEYIEMYGLKAKEFDHEGYATFAIDWRGQGASQRLCDDPLLGHIGQFSDFQKDVDAMLEAAKDLELPKPWFLVGHSMGACIGLRAMLNGLEVKAAAFVSPMWFIKMSPLERAVAWPVAWLAKAIGKAQTRVPGFQRDTYVLTHEFEGNKMTNDPEMYHHWVKLAQVLKELPIGGPSMGWLIEAMKECQSLSQERLPDIPCSVYCGDQDQDIDANLVKGRMADWPKGHYHLFPDSKHELFFEKPEVRNTMVSTMFDFFDTVHH